MQQPASPPPLRGIELRYLLTVSLLDADRSRTVVDLVDTVHAAGFALPGRASKAVSDALRWEIGKGRVQRVGRGRYAAGRMPRSTEWWLRARVTTVVERVVAPTLAT
jgi:hypothetical protein